jgi:putative hydrolase of HD superfamily
MVFIEDFPELDYLKCLKIALLHDIVEIFAWDTYIFDKEGIDTKKQRELESLKKIEKVLWENKFSDYKKIIEEYEDKNTKESIFVSQLDKLQPVIQVYIMWWKDHFTYKAKKEAVFENKYKIIDDTFGLRKVLDVYFEKLVKWNMFYIWD